MTIDLVVLGNLIVDDIVHDDGRTRMGQAGGAALYLSLAARLWGLAVAVASRVGEDFPEDVLAAMGARGIDCSLIRRLPGTGLRTWLLYEGGLRRVVHRLDGAPHRVASPTVEDLATLPQARAVHLAPMPFDLQFDLAAALAGSSQTLISLDPFELVAAESSQRWRELTAHLDLLFVSEDEIPDPAVRRHPANLLRAIGSERLRHILLKRGERGGLVFDSRTGETSDWRTRAHRVEDPTGAGDAFAAGTLAGLIVGDSLERAVQRGVVSASFAIESPGAEALFAATPDMATDRLKAWFA